MGWVRPNWELVTGEHPSLIGGMGRTLPEAIREDELPPGIGVQAARFVPSLPMLAEHAEHLVGTAQTIVLLRELVRSCNPEVNKQACAVLIADFHVDDRLCQATEL